MRGKEAVRRSSLFACAHVFTDKKAGIHILVTTPPIININNKITSTASRPRVGKVRRLVVIVVVPMLVVLSIFANFSRSNLPF